MLSTSLVSFSFSELGAPCFVVLALSIILKFISTLSTSSKHQLGLARMIGLIYTILCGKSCKS